MKEYEFANWHWNNYIHHELLKTKWLNYAGRNYDHAFEKSLRIFNSLVNKESADWLAIIQNLNNYLVIEFPQTLQKNGRTIPLADVMFGRIYVLACYFMYDDAYCVNTLIPKMEQMVTNAILREDMYYMKRKIAELCRPNSLLAKQVENQLENIASKMENKRQETDAEKILRFIAYSAGAHQPVHPMMVLQVAIRLLDFYRSHENYLPRPNARHCIDLGQHQVQIMQKRCFDNNTIGCLVAAAIYIIIKIDDKKIAREDKLALDIHKTLSNSFDIRFDDIVVEQIIKEIQEYKRTAPPTFNPFAEFDAIAKGKNLAHVDWIQLLTELDKYQNLSNEKFPYYIMLHGFLRAIPRPIDRVDILGYLEDAAEQIFAPGKAKEFVTGARSLVALYTKVNSRGLNHPIMKHWADSDLNEFTMLMETITPQEFVAISQSMVEARVVTHVRFGFIPHILRHENYLGEIVTKSGYEFCRGLYHAEGLREWLISGEGDNYDQLPSLDTLELEFINECYDIFIDYHTKGIKKTYTNIQQRNKNEYEYYRELLENLKHEFKELPVDEIHSKDVRTIKAHKSVRARFRDLIKYVEQRVKAEKAKHAPIQMVKSETANTNDENVGNLPNTPTIKDLEKVFLPCYTKINDCGMLLNILIEKRDNVSDPEWARYALTIYESKKIFKNYPKSFKEWLPIFCTLFGREVDYRAPSNIKRTICETDITPFLPKLM
jgi:hypothetical protein